MTTGMNRRGFMTLGLAAASYLGTTPVFAATHHHPVKSTAHALPLHDAAAHAAKPKLAATAKTHERIVRIINAHTREQLETVYWRNGHYLPGAMHQVAHVMRDHMSNEAHVIDHKLMDLLGDLHHALGTTEPFEVISGYRSPRTNAWMARMSSGVAAHSLHMKGMAADVTLPGHNIATIHNAALQLAEGGVGYYPRSGFVHVDTGKVRQWYFG